MIQEIQSIIKQLPAGKYPAPDGLTGEYYKQFSHILAPHMSTIFKNAASSSLFQSEMLQANDNNPSKAREGADLPPNF